MSDKVKEIYTVLSMMTFFLLVFVVFLLVDAIYSKSDYIFIYIVSVMLVLCSYIYQRKQIQSR